MVSQIEALDETIASLELRPEHAALIGMCRGMAEAIDQYPERATLWREYRPALEVLLAAGEPEVDDRAAKLLRLVSTPMEHEEDTGT